MTSTLDTLKHKRKQRVTFTSPKLENVYTMDIDEFARWCCLIEALEHIHEVSPHSYNDNSWINTNAIKRYIDETHDKMLISLFTQCTT